MAVVELTKADDGTTITVSRGDEIVVRLDENPTTGYRWRVHGSEGGVVAAGDSFALAPNARFGTGGERTFRFRADQPGAARVELTRLQPWEGEQSADARFTIDIRIVG